MEMAKYSADDFKACTVTVRKIDHNLKRRNGLCYCFDESFFTVIYIQKFGSTAPTASHPSTESNYGGFQEGFLMIYEL